MVNTVADDAADVGDEFPGSVGRFLRFDRFGAAGGAAFLLLANGIFVQEPGAWLVMPFILSLVAVLSYAIRSLQRGRVRMALSLAMIGNWVLALAVATLLPFLWPVMILTVIMPLVLSTPFLSRRALVVAIGAAAGFASVVGLIGLLNDDGGVIEDIDDEIELVLVVGALAAHLIPIALIVWDHNRLQRNALHRARVLNAELSSSRRRVVEASDDARSRIERDLHDGAQQQLVALSMRLRLLESTTPRGSTPELEGIIDGLDEAVDSLRDLAHGIYPPILAARGVAEAIRNEARRSPSDIAVSADGLPRLDPTVEATLYFVALEALANASKHAPNTPVRVELELDAGVVRLSVADAGSGFTPHHDRSTTGGLANMADRVAAVGGAFSIESGSDGGTVVSVRIPIAENA